MVPTSIKQSHPLLSFIDRHAFLFSLLFFFFLFIGGDRLLNEYYLPDAKGIENSYYHHGLRKNYQGTVSWGQEKHPLYTNDLGFKDDQCRIVPRKADRRRVLFIGDSFTEGAGLPFEQTFVGMFKQALPQVDVLNAGVVSFSPKLFYYRLKYLLEVEKLQFDELFVFVDISDISDEIEYSLFTPVEESPLRRLDAWLRSISFTYKTLRNNLLNVEKNKMLQQLVQRIDAGKKVSTESPAKEGGPDLSQQPAAGAADVAVAGPPHLAMPADFREKRVQERPRWTFDKGIYEKWGRAGMGLAQYNMDKVVQLMRKHGIPVTLAVYPWPDQIREKDRNSIQEVEWQRFCAEKGIDFVSYFEDFVRDDPEKIIQKYFIPGDVHWNEQGHALVFQKLKTYYGQSHRN
jgi:lysophospholipase L1-like esterase